MRKTKLADKPKTFIVGIEYTVKGSVSVSASDEAAARVAAYEEMICPAQGCDITDMNILSVRREES